MRFIITIALALMLFMGIAGANYVTVYSSDVTGTTNQGLQTVAQVIGNLTADTGPEASDDDQIMVAYTNAFNSSTAFVLTPTSSQFLAQPDQVRNIIVTMNTSTSCALKLTGTDISGASSTENLTWSTESGAKASTKAFKTITRIDATTTDSTAQAKVGTGDLLGLNTKMPRNHVTRAYLNNVLEGTAPTVTFSSSSLPLNTVDLQSSYSGKPVIVEFLI